MDHSKLIDALGGTQEVAQALGCHPGHVSRYRIQGIYPPRFPVIVEMARKRGVPGVTYEALFAGMPGNQEPEPAQ